MEIEKFIELVTTNPSRLLGIEANLEIIYDYYGLTKTSNISRTVVLAYLHDCIRGNLSSNLSEIKSICKGIIKNLFFKLSEDTSSLNIFCGIIEEVYNAIRKSSAPLGAISNWEKVFIFAADAAYISQLGNPRENDQFTNLYNREFEIARAAKHLVQHGFPIEMNSKGDIIIDEQSLVDYICTLFSQLGGLNVIQQILEEMSLLYDKKQMRFHLVRKMNTPDGLCTSAIPWGYLMQMAVKKPDCVKKTLTWNKNWEKLKAITRDYIALFNVQPYLLLELMFHDATSMVDYFIELTFYDKSFCIYQLKPLYVTKIIDKCLSWINTQEVIYKGINFNDIYTAAKAIISLGMTQKGPIVFTVKDIAKYCKNLSLHNIGIILTEIFSHPYQKANDNYYLARDIPKKNTSLYLRPLLMLKNNEYYLINISFCSYGIIEAIFDIIRNYNKRSDTIIGEQIEILLKESLLEKGINSSRGEYFIKKQKFQCDCIIETENIVYIIEIKKKTLTPLARSGNDRAIVIDLTKSLLESQIQAIRHEIILRKTNLLKLNNNGITEKVQLNGRLIERVTVTLFDYGSLQHKVFVQSFLKSCIQNIFSFTIIEDEKIQKDYDNLVKILNEFRLAWNELAALNENEHKNPFGRCSFISMPLMLTLLERVNSKEDFHALHSKLSYMVFDSFDQYHNLTAVS